ncbi:MAG: toprim domain-containing protein [Rhodospirillales bacterium]|nr:toprim domain-containing protein [Rhodospirillales bacterium]
MSDAERRAAKLARAAALWASAEPITADCPAGRYLRHRRIEHVMESRALRWRSDTPHPAGGRRVALLAKITATDGTLAGLQRIYLDRDGNKATVEPVKASLGLIAGGAVRLQDCSAELVVGEGIETSAAAGALLSRPAWAAVSCGNLGRSLILPPEIRSIIIAVDADEPGQAAARAAWQRWAREGRRVRLATPKEAGADFSDIVMGAGQ